MGHDIPGFRGFNELMGTNRLVIEGYFLIYQTIFTDTKIQSVNHAVVILLRRQAPAKQGISIQ
jgi:hypothetical protein